MDIRIRGADWDKFYEETEPIEPGKFTVGVKQVCLDRFSAGGENFLREHIRSLRPHYTMEPPEIATGLSTRKALDKLVVWLRALIGNGS